MTLDAANNLTLASLTTTQQHSTDLQKKDLAWQVVKGSGDTILAAGNSLNLGTLATASANSVVWNATNRRSDASAADVGSTVQAQDDLRLQAGGDLSARAASVQAQGDLLASAGRDIKLTAGQSGVQLDEAHQQIDKGFLSKKITTTRDTLDQTTAQATLLGGRTVLLQAGQDIAVQGSSVIGDGVAGGGGAAGEAGGATTTLLAGRDVLLSAQETQTQSSQFSQTRKSGLMSSGLSVTLGKQDLSTDQLTTTRGAAGATVGAIAGDVLVVAGRHYAQAGSDLLAPAGSIEVAAQDIRIAEARTREQTDTEQKFKQSGLTVAITAPVVSALQGMARTTQALSHTSDTRTQALGAATLAMQGQQALSGLSSVGDALANGANPADAASIGISFSVGASQSSSTRQTTQNGAQGSSLSAAGSVNLSASGNNNDNGDHNSGNLLIQGSSVRAGEQVNLVAHNRIELHAATQTTQESSRQSSQSGSVGVGISFGAQTSVGVTVAASVGKGAGAGEDVTHANTRIEAGQGVRLQSGGDATLAGAVVQARQVSASVGDDLRIESLQDTSSYTERSKSAGGSVTFGPAAGASLGLSSTKINSQLASVTEQSAIQSGDGGFNVNVLGTTDLVGGAITSTDKALQDGRNSFTTAALTLSDIDNRASYKASSVGVSVGAGASKGASAGLGSDKGSASSTTLAAISGIAGNKDARTGDAQTAIAPIFDKNKVRDEVSAQVQITQEFGKQASRAVGDYAAKQLKEAEKAGDQTGIDAWKEGGTNRVALHALVGGLTGGVAGALGSGAASAAAPVIDQLQGQLKSALKDAGLGESAASVIASLSAGATAATIGAAASGGSTAGAATAFNADMNNRQLHPSERKLAADLAQKSGGKYTAEQIENALRNSGNSALGESIISGMVVSANDPNGVYDPGAQFNAGEDGKTAVQKLPDGGQVDSALAAFITANTGGNASPYGWQDVQLGKVAPMVASPNYNTITPASNGCVTVECAAGVASVKNPVRDMNDVRNDVADGASVVSRGSGIVGSTATAAATVPGPHQPGAATTAVVATGVGFAADVVEQMARPDARKFFVEQMLLGIPAYVLAERYPVFAPVINEAQEQLKETLQNLPAGMVRA